MNRYRELQPTIDGIFHQRGEEVVAHETVSEIGNKKKASTPRLLILSHFLGSSGSATLSIVTVNPSRQRVKLKSAFAVDRLISISNEGSFDAAFNFGSSGVLSVSFESHIQREMFLAAARRILAMPSSSSGAHGGYAENRMSPIHGVLTEAVGAQVEADAAARVRKLRQDKRRVFTTEEEKHLLRHIGNNGAGFDDIKQFQEILLRQQKNSELRSLNLLTTSEAAWQEAQRQVQDLVQDVEEVEQRIESYSKHLLSKKAVLQQVEHTNNTLQRRQQNLEALYMMMSDLRDQLRLAPATMTLLSRLRTIPEDCLVAFFSEGSNAVTLSMAMKHMQSVLHNPKLDSDFPIAAVAERKVFFLEQRKMIAQRSKLYIMAIIESFEAKYLADKARYSRDALLVWQLHVELAHKLIDISGVICALECIDVEGFNNVLRKYRTSMQKVYALEITHFFKCLKKQVKKVNTWRGPFLLGTSESRREAMSMRMETAQSGETPRMYSRYGQSTPALTPRMMRFGDDSDQGASAGGWTASGTGGNEDHTHLSVQFPSAADLSMEGGVPASAIQLYQSANTLRRLDSRAEVSSVVSGIKSLSPTSTSGGGYVRPDLAFAIALESSVLAVINEEAILHRCFNLFSTPEEKSGNDHSAAGSSSTGASPQADDSKRTGAATLRGAAGTDRAQMKQESLLELFGGVDANYFVRALQGMSRSDSAQYSCSNSQDIGLPPRPPPAGYGGGSWGQGNSSFPHRRTWSGTSSAVYDRERNSIAGDEVDGGGPDDEASRASRIALHRNFLIRTMRDLALFVVEKCDRIYCVPILCMIRAYRATAADSAMLPSKSAFCQAMLGEVEAVMVGGMTRFVAEQTDSIHRCRKRYVVHPTPLLHCFSKMPALFLRLEAVHNALAPNVCDRTEYASIALSLVDQSFDALDQITNVRGTGEDRNAGHLKLNELIAQKLHSVLDGVEADISSLKWVFVQQYRHQSFFCAFYSTMPSDSFAVELLQDHYASAKAKRDRYEELYLTRVLLVRSFPVFGIFALSAEDLSMIYSKEELRHHKALSVDAVEKVLSGLEKEMRSGVRASAERMKRHFLRDVDLGGNEASFHTTLLQRTWQHFSTLLLRKFDFLAELLSWPAYRDIFIPITRSDVVGMLAAY
ncbi:exocyst complex component 1-like protein [Leishmania panamensis]|uniref:Exocyst complex component 1-like protein n=1 Tax=Leishmania panamensis TaxID=5679 RepID=A0A088RJ19_LEIPA|nr:exocyst complex component 1-like protein [Leishmania panamensis]AIN95903.1 exocyst complex component 1-like protein [Leishmania panamensis]